MVGQRSAAHTRDQAPQENPAPNMTNRATPPATPRRVSTVSHVSCGLRMANRPIALQPSGTPRRLPAPAAALTIRAHVGPARGAPVARPVARGDARPRRAPGARAAHRLLRLRPDRPQPAAGQSRPADAAAALASVRPPADRTGGRG